MQDHWRREWRGAGHKEAVERVYCCGSLGQYITGGRGGALRWGVVELCFERACSCIPLARCRMGSQHAGSNMGNAGRVHARVSLACCWPPTGDVFRVWNAETLAPAQALANGSGWVTDCAYLECPAYKRLVIAAQDRTVGWPGCRG